ncbi:hypothetical protein OPIT5_10695 [Opitutaceae bacterium TAV5]|nr:hypothetical protein OPIT5_10695 [Opitutaceae bacterium TAV5]
MPEVARAAGPWTAPGVANAVPDTGKGARATQPESRAGSPCHGPGIRSAAEWRRPCCRDTVRGGIAIYLLLLVVMALAGAVLVWMLLAPGVLARRLQVRTGFGCEVTTLVANPFGGTVRAGEFVIRNPAGFSSRVFLRGRSLEASGGSAAGLLPGGGTDDGGPLVFRKMRLELDTAEFARDADGRDNFTAFAATLPPVRIDEFLLVVASMPATATQPGREAFSRTYRSLRSFEPVLADLAHLAATGGGEGVLPVTAPVPFSPSPVPAPTAPPPAGLRPAPVTSGADEKDQDNENAPAPPPPGKIEFRY